MVKVQVISRDGWPENHPFSWDPHDEMFISLSSAVAMLYHLRGCVVVWSTGAYLLVNETPEGLLAKTCG